MGFLINHSDGPFSVVRGSDRLPLVPRVPK